MFIFLGCITVLIGATTIVFLPDTPMSARFLSDSEKAALLHHVSINQTDVRNTHFKMSHIFEALLDIQLWLMTLITILISVSSGVVTTYSATLIKNIGYKPDTAAILDMPAGIVSIFATLAVGFGVRHFSTRWAFLIACCIPGIIGGGLMSFLPSSKTHHDKGGLLAGIYLINFIVATLIIIYQWTASNVAGHTKRVFAMALISGSFSVGNIIGPQTFQAKDAPQYIPAKITVLATQGAAALVTFVLFCYYRWANMQKDKKQGALDNTTGEDKELRWDNLTDKENSAFRYVY